MTAPTNLRDFRAGAARIQAKRAAEIIIDPEKRAEAAVALQFVIPGTWSHDKREGFQVGIALAAKAAIDYAARLGSIGKPNLQALGLSDILVEASRLAEEQSKAIDANPPVVAP